MLPLTSESTLGKILHSSRKVEAARKLSAVCLETFLACRALSALLNTRVAKFSTYACAARSSVTASFGRSFSFRYEANGKLEYCRLRSVPICLGTYCFEVIEESCSVLCCLCISAVKISREHELNSPIVTWSSFRTSISWRLR